MTRHGSLLFGDYHNEDWDYLKQVLAELTDFDPYEPDWRDR